MKCHFKFCDREGKFPLVVNYGDKEKELIVCEIHSPKPDHFKQELLAKRRAEFENWKGKK